MTSLRKINAKMVQFDYDFLLSLGAERCMYCLSPQTVQLAISMMEMAGWQTRYFSLIETELDRSVIAGWAEKAQRELMTDNCVSELQVQQLIDQSQSQIYLTWSEATTNTEINNYAPITTFIETTGDDGTTIAERDNALCYACQKFIDAMCAGIQETLQQPITLAQLGAAAIAVVGLILAPWTGGASLLYVTSIISAIAYLGASSFDFISDAVLEDADAQQEVTCAMWNALRLLEPTEANFISACTGLTGLGTNATLIAEALALVTNEPANQEDEFNSFINVLGEGLVLANAGVLPPCECCTTPPLIFDWYGNVDDLTGWTTLTSEIADPSADPEATGDVDWNSWIFPYGEYTTGHHYIQSLGVLSGHNYMGGKHDVDPGGCVITAFKAGMLTTDIVTNNPGVKLWVHNGDGWQYLTQVAITVENEYHEIEVAVTTPIYDIDEFLILAGADVDLYTGYIKLTFG